VIRLSSIDDARLADYRLLADPSALIRDGLFVAEGRFVVRRLLAQRRFRTRSILVTDAAHTALHEELAAIAPTIPVYVVDQTLMNGVTGFNMHRGCLAIGVRGSRRMLADEDLSHARRLVVLEGVNNPDNIGGIFRSAEAFGTDLVVVGPGCSDPLYRKSIRTSMAATLQLPFVFANHWPAALTSLRAAGFAVVALTPAADAVPLDDLPRGLARVALLAGAEGDGLSAAALAAATDRVRIPMRGQADSLNVVSAASIALHHFSEGRG
jgi:tRNA G18 (ribose-2'-O)-methylase SpoU